MGWILGDKIMSILLVDPISGVLVVVATIWLVCLVVILCIFYKIYQVNKMYDRKKDRYISVGHKQRVIRPIQATKYKHTWSHPVY